MGRPQRPEVCSVSVALAISCAVGPACSKLDILFHHDFARLRTSLLVRQVRQPRETGAVGWASPRNLTPDAAQATGLCAADALLRSPLMIPTGCHPGVFIPVSHMPGR